MPIIRVELLEGRPPETKEALIRRITDVVEETLGGDRQRIRVVLHELPPENWGVGGTSLAQSRPAPLDEPQ